MCERNKRIFLQSELLMKSTDEFIKIMTEAKDIMVTFDVVNFYYSTNINEIQNIVNKQKQKDKNNRNINKQK